jgi:hypothetical protein
VPSWTSHVLEVTAVNSALITCTWTPSSMLSLLKHLLSWFVVVGMEGLRFVVDKYKTAVVGNVDQIPINTRTTRFLR